MEGYQKKDEDFEETIKSIEKTMASLEKKSYDGMRDILKYFDRIHDKLFTFNNIMIVGFFTISKMKDNISIELILVPIFNLCFLIYIEYRMMEKSRKESNIFQLTKNEIHSLGSSIDKTTNYSLFSIFTTLVVTCFFLYNLFK